MNSKILKAEHKGKGFKIVEEVPEVGVYVYENDVYIKDFLQDSIFDCKDIAYKNYGVEDSKWSIIF